MRSDANFWREVSAVSAEQGCPRRLAATDFAPADQVKAVWRVHSHNSIFIDRHSLLPGFRSRRRLLVFIETGFPLDRVIVHLEVSVFFPVDAIRVGVANPVL